MTDKDASSGWSAWKVWRHPGRATDSLRQYAGRLSCAETEISSLNADLTTARLKIETLTGDLAEERRGNVEMLQELSAAGMKEQAAQADLKAALIEIENLKSELAAAEKLHCDMKDELQRLRVALAVAREKVTDLSMELSSAVAEKDAARREARTCRSNAVSQRKNSDILQADIPLHSDDSEWLEDIPEEFR